MSELDDDLKATAQSIIRDAERISEIEQVKLGMDAADPQVERLAREAETVAADLLQKAAVEHDLAIDAVDEASRLGDQETQRPSR